MAVIRPKDEFAATTVAAGDVYLIDGPGGVRALAATVVPIRDASGNVSINNVFEGYITTVTAAGTTTLSNASAGQQFFTGTTTQTVVLPDVSTLKLGAGFLFQNNSTGSITVNSSGGGLVKVIGPGGFANLVCIAITGNTPASWSATYISSSTGGAGNTVNFDTRAVAMGASISSTVQGIQTFGYGAAGDGGGARYRKVGSLGAGMLGFQSADGAWWEIAETYMNPHMAGALGDGTTDDSVAIRAAIASVPIGGNLVFLPNKIYGVTQDGANAWCIRIPMPISVFGFGGYSDIKPLASVGATVNTLYFMGSASAEIRTTVVHHLFLGDRSNGSRNGFHGMVFDTTVAGANMRELVVEQNFICPGSGSTGRAIFHNNNPTNNANGGMFASTFRGNVLAGGTYFSQSGDSICIEKNIITGNNIGVHVDLVANATGPYIRDNNITTVGGAVKIDRAYLFVIDGGIFEMNPGAAGSNGAIVDINGGTSTVVGGVVRNVVFVPLTGTSVTKLLRIRNSIRVKAEDNSFAGSGFTAVDIAASNGCILGRNLVGSGNTLVVDDGTSGTVGVKFVVGASGRPAFLNSWGNVGTGYQVASFYKDENGIVHIEGQVSGGTLNSAVFTLPLGYRPAFNTAASAPSGFQTIVLTTGDVQSIASSSTNNSISNVSFLAADEGHVRN